MKAFFLQIMVWVMTYICCRKGDLSGKYLGRNFCVVLFLHGTVYSTDIGDQQDIFVDLYYFEPPQPDNTDITIIHPSWLYYMIALTD